MNLYNQFVKKVSFPWLARRDGLSKLTQHLDEFEKTQFWSRDKIEELQLERLRFLLNHAYKSTAYYRRIFDEISFRPESVSSLDDIKSLPLLSKNIVRDNGDDLRSTSHSLAQVHFCETGGTTGVKMKFWRDNACLAQKEAARYRFEKWTDWDIGERVGLVWTAQQDYVGHWTTKAKIRNELFERQVVLPAAVMDEEKLVAYLHLLEEKKPTMIRAFTSPLYEVARVALDMGMRCHSVKGVVTTGEPLYKHQRKVIEKAFGCRVFDSYRSREAGPLAQECQEHKGLHINAESLLLEIVEPEDSKSFDQGIGEIVITDLLNFGMPLIRYKMGDMGIISDRQCSCGRGLPILEQITGRSADILHTPDGKLVTAGSLVLYLVDEAPGMLGQVQVIQDKLDHLLIRMTDDPPPTEEIKEYQRKTVQRLFGSDMAVSFEIVDKISRGNSGKYQFAKYVVTV